jgi:hypothetical protein
MSGVLVRWARGGEARLVSIDARAIVLRSTVPSPPGSRIEGTFESERPEVLRVKVHACRRQPEGDFVLQGRPIDLPRDARHHLESLVR